MQAPHAHICRDQQLWLAPDRSIFWENENALIVSDLHFGKTGHFRKSGIAVPQAVYREDLQRLVARLQHTQATKLLVVGDLFHSHQNKELEWFCRWREDFEYVEIVLIRGNHDILHDDWYRKAGIIVKEGQWNLGNFCFTHDINFLQPGVQPYYTFTGHIHPGVRISGAGKQSLSFPCFYFGESFAVLPAFSRFTGIAIVEPKQRENVFAIVENKILQLQ